MRRAKHRFAVGCCCEETCPTIGFEGGRIATVVNCCTAEVSGYPYIQSISSTLDPVGLRQLLNQITVLFMGDASSCGYEPIFNLNQRDVVGDWLYDGGKIYLAGEHYPNCDSLVNIQRINEFLADVGSTMELIPKSCNAGCYGPGTGFTPGTGWCGEINHDELPFLDTIDCIYHAATSEVSGGTWISKTVVESMNPACVTPYPFISVERVGDGIICLVGDSNLPLCISSPPNYDNCPFYRSFIETPTNQIL